MVYIKRFMGLIMLLVPFAGAFYITYRMFGNLQVATYIWGAIVVFFLYILLATTLLFSSSTKREDRLEKSIEDLLERVRSIENKDNGE